MPEIIAHYMHKPYSPVPLEKLDPYIRACAEENNSDFNPDKVFTRTFTYSDQDTSLSILIHHLKQAFIAKGHDLQTIFRLQIQLCSRRL